MYSCHYILCKRMVYLNEAQVCIMMFTIIALPHQRIFPVHSYHIRCWDSNYSNSLLEVKNQVISKINFKWSHAHQTFVDVSLQSNPRPSGTFCKIQKQNHLGLIVSCRNHWSRLKWWHNCQILNKTNSCINIQSFFPTFKEYHYALKRHEACTYSFYNFNWKETTFSIIWSPVGVVWVQVRTHLTFAMTNICLSSRQKPDWI